MKYEALAKKLYKSVMSEYNNRAKWDKRSLSMMLDEYLKDFNKDAKKLIEKEIYDNLNKDYFPTGDTPLVASSVELSTMLYNNAKDVSKRVVQILAEGNKAKKTIKDISMQIYDGYNSDIDNLDVKEKLPKYLQEDKNALLQIEKLKTKNLKIAYKKVLEVMKDINSNAFEKALYVALQEKSRYYADRIAKTEAHRSLMLSRAKEYFEDDEIKLVKYTMSSSHKIMDICNYYASMDVGYGAGVVPKGQMICVPVHPHCHCTYVPVYKEIKKKRVKNPTDETMQKFSKDDQRQILGSQEKLKDFEDGADIENIFNRVRPKYPITKYVDIF